MEIRAMPLPLFAEVDVMRVRPTTATANSANVRCRILDIFEGFGLGGSDEGAARVYAAFSGSSLLALAGSIIAKTQQDLGRGRFIASG